MTERGFWRIVAESRRAIDPKRRGGNFRRQRAALERRLARLAPAEIADFARWYYRFVDEAYTWNLWGAAFLLAGGCSDDAFDDFRCWLVAQGRGTYRRIVDRPDALASLVDAGGFDDFFFEEIGAVPFRVYEKATGEELPFRRRQPARPRGRKWRSDEELERRYPRLARALAA